MVDPVDPARVDARVRPVSLHAGRAAGADAGAGADADADAGADAGAELGAVAAGSISNTATATTTATTTAITEPITPTRKTGRRYDTFFIRLFVLMWVTLVVSHAVAYFTLMIVLHETEVNGPRIGFDMPMPTFPSLPPGNPFDGDAGRPVPPDARGGGGFGPDASHAPDGERDPGFERPNSLPSIARANPGRAGPGVFAGAPPMFSPGDRPALPRHWLWLDYGVRLLVMALGAALGARWLATPMRRVSVAASSLSESFGRDSLPQGIDERRGSIEVRDTARAFNSMASRLQQQYDARGLQMASVSHDLRTPLARLRLRLERLPDDGIVRKAIADIHEMDDMIDGTLAVLREQQEGADASVVDVSALLQSMVDDLVDQGQRARFDDAPPTRVRARPAALRRVIGNLLGNAIRYGGGARIALHRAPAGLMVTIDDDGPGIPEAELSRAFEPWVRLGRHVEADAVDDRGGSRHPDHPGRARRTGHTGHSARLARSGHGLGLAIARDLARRDGGDVFLANRPEGGLRVTVRLVPVR